MKEQDTYVVRKMFSKDDPHGFLSIIVESADQKNYGAQHFVEASKSDHGHQLKVKIVAAI